MSVELYDAWPRRAYHRHEPHDLRRAVLRAATAEFAENGLGGARVDAIAQRASTNKRMLYLYFGDKRELYEAVLAGLLAGLRRVIDDLTGHLAASPEVIRLLGRDPRLCDPQSPANVRLVALLRTGVEQGAFHVDATPATLYLSIIALAATPAEARADIASLVLGYLRPSPS